MHTFLWCSFLFSMSLLKSTIVWRCVGVDIMSVCGSERETYKAEQPNTESSNAFQVCIVVIIVFFVISCIIDMILSHSSAWPPAIWLWDGIENNGKRREEKSEEKRKTKSSTFQFEFAFACISSCVHTALATKTKAHMNEKMRIKNWPAFFSTLFYCDYICQMKKQTFPMKWSGLFWFHFIYCCLMVSPEKKQRIVSSNKQTQKTWKTEWRETKKKARNK